MSPQYLHLLKFQKNLLPREEKSAELISANYTPNMLSVSKHVVENDVSFFMKVNCQEKQQKN